MRNNDRIVITKVGNGFIVRPNDEVVANHEVMVFQDKGIAVVDSNGGNKTLLEFISEHFTDKDDQ